MQGKLDLRRPLACDNPFPLQDWARSGGAATPARRAFDRIRTMHVADHVSDADLQAIIEELRWA